MLDEIDKRRSERFHADALSVDIKYQDERRRHQRFDKVIPIDFNRFGISFKSRLSLDIHDEILLKCTHSKRHLGELVGFICNKNELEGTYRYGILFDFSANDFMSSREVKSTLVNFELLLTKDIDGIDSPLNRNAYRRIKKT